MGKLIKIKKSAAGLVDAAALSCGKAELIAGKFLCEAEVCEAEGCATLVEGCDATTVNAGKALAEGELIFRGNVGANAAKDMADGILRVEGSAGEYACANMQGGLAVFTGDVANGFGADMRRGIAVVYGQAHGNVLMDMLGGTAILLGGLAEDASLCLGMNRGTVILPSADLVPEGFQKAADVDIMFLRVLFRELADRGVNVPESWIGRPFTRWRGDMAALGKGEILTPAE